MKKNDIVRKWNLGRLDIRFSWRRPGNLGRFGGGWNWAIGVAAGRRSVHFSLLVAELNFSLEAVR